MKNLSNVSFVIALFILLFPCKALKGAQFAVLLPNTVRQNCEAFLEACQSGDVQTLQTLLMLDGTNLDIDYCNESGESALHLAVIHEHAAICALLLQSEIDLHLKDSSKETALRRAAIQNNRAILEEFRNARIIGTQEQNSQNLLRACRLGFLEEVEELLELQGSDYLDIDETDDQGNSVLHLAVLGRHAEICKVLIGSGIDTDIHNNDTFTALHLAYEQAGDDSDDEVLEVVKNGATTEDMMENLIAFASDAEENVSDTARADSESHEFFNEVNDGDADEDPLSGIDW